MSLARYSELLDWVGRSIRSDKRSAIPEGLAPILSRKMNIELRGQD